MSGGGGGGDTTTVQRADPWAGQQPYLKRLWERTEALPIQEPYPFPGYVPWSPTTIGAMEATMGRALAGSPLLPAAQMENLATTRGGYLDIAGTPAFRRAFDVAAGDIIPGIQGAAVGAGRYGGGLTRQAEIEALGDQFFRQWAPLYSAERDRMMRATMAAPALAEADYSDIGRLYGVGAMQEQKAGEALADAMRRWQFQQQAPYTQLTTQAPIIGGTSVGGVTTTDVQGQGMNPITSALSGGMMGAYLGGPMGLTGLGLSPVGGFGIGAGLGLLASMM